MVRLKILSFINLVTITVSALIIPLLYSQTVAAGGKQVSGWIEKVAVGNPPFILRAKIDTGAKNSSLHAGDYQLYEKQGTEWVKFTLKNKEGASFLVDKPVKRVTQIKQKGNRPNRRRPVIEMGICMGNVYKEVEVNLADRANFNYPMLVGRSFLQGSFVVDSGQKHLLEPDCKRKWSAN